MRDYFNLGDLIDRTPGNLERTAIIDLGAGEPRHISFGEFDAMVAGVARALLASGLARGDHVALLSANRSEYLAAYLGAMQAGLVAVPVNHRFPRELSDFVLRDSQARLVFCDAERLPACPGDIPAVVFNAPGASAALTGAQRSFDDFLDPGPHTPVVPRDDETAMLLYTSGSTGQPKGVMLSHRSHLWVVRARMEGQDLARHRFLIAAPLYHMNALALSKLTLAAGATMVLLPQFTSRGYIDAIGRYRCSWLTAVPPMIAMMLRETGLMAATDLSSVEFLRMGSAPVSPALLEAIHRAMPQATVVNAFGSTEAGPVIFGPHPHGKVQPPLSVGCAHPKVQLRLVDGDDADAAQGVLQLRSPGLMTGYHRRPDLKPPFTPDGYYITGDVFRRDADGFHYFVGRTDDMFVCGGENIYPSEIEKLLESHADIVQACVVPIDDDIKGQKPVAFCVLRSGAAL
ncbi:MAG: class I adenylate-forming enzyme family protein, partial [Caldimonas sp.]